MKAYFAGSIYYLNHRTSTSEEQRRFFLICFIRLVLLLLELGERKGKMGGTRLHKVYIKRKGGTDFGQLKRKRETKR